MVAIYVLTRISFLVISLVDLGLSIVPLVRELQGHAGDTTNIVSMALVIVVLFIGAYGSYKHDRSWLMSFALILIIVIVVGFFAKSPFYWSLGWSMMLVILSLTQAELIKRGYH